MEKTARKVPSTVPKNDHSKEISTKMSDFKVHNWIVLVSFF